MTRRHNATTIVPIGAASRRLRPRSVTWLITPLLLGLLALLGAGCTQHGNMPASLQAQHSGAEPQATAASNEPAEGSVEDGNELQALLTYFRRSALLTDTARQEQLAALLERIQGDDCTANRVRAAALLTRAEKAAQIERAGEVLAPCLGYPVYVSDAAKVAAAPIGEVITALQRAHQAEQRAAAARQTAQRNQQQDSKSSQRIAKLSAELKATNERLKNTYERLKATYDRLKAANQRLDITTEQLEGLKSIERSIQRRESKTADE